MYKLYYYPGNANLAPHMVLEEIGAPHELILLDRDRNAHKSPEYLKLNPHGRIPTLIDGELVLYETSAICMHLADRHPEAKLAPELGSAARAQFYKWMVYLTNTVQSEMIVYFYPERWGGEGACKETVKANAEQRLAQMFDTIEQNLGENGSYLLGDRFSAADLMLLMLGRWSRGFKRPARTLPALGRFLERVAARPAVQRAFAAEGIKAPLY
jgi:glutathione S-transferase